MALWNFKNDFTVSPKIFTAGIPRTYSTPVALISSSRESEWVNYAFMGIRAGVAVLLINATIRLSKALHANIFNIVLIVLAFIATVFFDISVIMIILAAALVGVITRILRTRKQRGQIE